MLKQFIFFIFYYLIYKFWYLPFIDFLYALTTAKHMLKQNKHLYPVNFRHMISLAYLQKFDYYLQPDECVRGNN